MPGHKTDWRNDAARAPVPPGPAEFPPEVWPISATILHMDAFRAQAGPHGQKALRTPKQPEDGDIPST